jgi:hypothetical protein
MRNSVGSSEFQHEWNFRPWWPEVKTHKIVKRRQIALMRFRDVILRVCDFQGTIVLKPFLHKKRGSFGPLLGGGKLSV